MASLCPAQGECLCLRPALVGVGVGVGVSLEALFLRPPLGVFVLFFLE
jgi:hypothetical protein